MGEFKGFMKYDKQYLGELSLVDRLKHHKAYQQRFTKRRCLYPRCAMYGLWNAVLSNRTTVW